MADDLIADVIERIRKLGNHTVENGFTEAEALLAATKMREIMDRHRLSQTDLEVQSDPVVTEFVRRPTKIQPAPIDLVMHGIDHYCGTKHYFQYRDRVRMLAILGLKPDVAMATYLYRMLVATSERATKEYQKTRQYLTADDKRTATDSFKQAFAERVWIRLDELATAQEPIAKTASGTDLVVAKNAIVQQAYDAITFGRPYMKQRKVKHDTLAFVFGTLAAEDVNLSRPLTQEEKAAITDKTLLFCPQCGVQVRVPIDRGTIKIKCPQGHQWTWTPAA